MEQIPYHHDRNLHSAEGALRALPALLEGLSPRSFLDVGAGTGSWLSAALKLGIEDVVGLDGVAAEGRHVEVDPGLIRTVDLRQPFTLGRTFEVVICLEVAEHLGSEHAASLVTSICAHGDRVYFSAAPPGQRGEHHVNCQWPTYWQALFNAEGFVCNDDVRWRLWDVAEIEPWYRQNLFLAVRDPDKAGTEPRIRSVIHPAMIQYMDFPDSPVSQYYAQLEAGEFSPWRYMWLLEAALKKTLPDA
jgi:SAM-dependent methyltransferase